MQVRTLDIIVGRIISVELVLPAVSLRPMTVVGNICIDTEFITKSIVPAKDIFPLLSSNSCIALIPLGVAALPSPNILEAIFIAMCLLAMRLSDLNKNLINGESKLASLSDKPLLSKILIIPSQTQYMPHKLIISSTALADESNIEDITSWGLLKIKHITDETIKINQIIDIFIYILKTIINLLIFNSINVLLKLLYLNCKK